jgi:hypothetical protein
MPFDFVYDGGFGMAPTRQVCAIHQVTEVSATVSVGTPVYLPQNVHGSVPSGDVWIGFTRPIFGFNLWVAHNSSIRIYLQTFGTTERDWRGWRLYKNMVNVLTGYEIPCNQFKVMLYADESAMTQFKGYVSVRSL